jgi:hypothetical protein
MSGSIAWLGIGCWMRGAAAVAVEPAVNLLAKAVDDWESDGVIDMEGAMDGVRDGVIDDERTGG